MRFLFSSAFSEWGRGAVPSDDPCEIAHALYFVCSLASQVPCEQSFYLSCSHGPARQRAKVSSTGTVNKAALCQGLSLNLHPGMLPDAAVTSTEVALQKTFVMVSAL